MLIDLRRDQPIDHSAIEYDPPAPHPSDRKYPMIGCLLIVGFVFWSAVGVLTYLWVKA